MYDSYSFLMLVVSHAVWILPSSKREHRIHVKDELEAVKQLPLTFARENILLHKNTES